jgi:hypothetical protein
MSVADARISISLLHTQLELEARVGIEPTMQLLQSRALPLGYPATGTMKLILFRIRSKFSFSGLLR